MNKVGYLERLCDSELKIALETSGAVLIEGPKWCGKTSTAEMAAKAFAPRMRGAAWVDLAALLDMA